MANLKSLAKDTAIYGLSSIVGRFLNYLLVPLYTHYMPKDSGDYGISTNIYAYTALILVLLTFGMETTLFRFANDERYKSDTVFSTVMATVGSLTIVFLLLIFGFIGPISGALGYSEHPDYLLMMAVVVALDALQAIPFSYLRFQKRAIRFASLKLLFIALNIGLNVFYFVVLGKTTVFYVFFINLLCTAFITLFFLPDLFRIHWHFDGQLLRRMFSYSWPILIAQVAEGNGLQRIQCYYNSHHLQVFWMLSISQRLADWCDQSENQQQEDQRQRADGSHSRRENGLRLLSLIVGIAKQGSLHAKRQQHQNQCRIGIDIRTYAIVARGFGHVVGI